MFVLPCHAFSVLLSFNTFAFTSCCFTFHIISFHFINNLCCVSVMLCVPFIWLSFALLFLYDIFSFILYLFSFAFPFSCFPFTLLCVFVVLLVHLPYLSYAFRSRCLSSYSHVLHYVVMYMYAWVQLFFRTLYFMYCYL